MEVLKADYRSPDAPAVFVRSMKETGFAALSKHPIGENLIREVYNEWMDFFESDAKFDYIFDKDTQAGYFPFKSENAKGQTAKDLKEFYHVYPNKKFPSQLSKKTYELRDALFSLGKTLLSWLEEKSPEQIRKKYSMPLPEMSEGSEKNLFRIIHYPPLTGSEDKNAVRAAAHEDINLITLLPASTAMGLQVKDLNGKWYDVPGDFGDIVVNVGDMLQMASGGYFRSTTHQVINPQGEWAKKSRFSMPLFVHPRPHVQLSNKHTAETYLKERLSEIGLL